MDSIKPIYWHEGLFLRPQHFQQLERNQQNFSFMMASQGSKIFWGLSSFSLVQAALNNNIVEIKECEIIFQDGTFISYPGNASIESRSFDGRWNVSGQTVSIYLGIKKLKVGVKNVTPTMQAATIDGAVDYAVSRFTVTDNATSVADFYDNGKYEDLYYLEHNVRIFINEEAKEALDFTLIKVAELQKIGSEVLVSRYYIPPLINFGASNALFNIVRNITEHATSLASTLKKTKIELDVGRNGINDKELACYFALQTLNRYIPLLSQHCEDRVGSPWTLYGLLRQMAGELSTYAPDIDVFGECVGDEGYKLPKYDHVNLTKCFVAVAKLITKLTSDLIAGPDSVVNLNYDGTYFSSTIDSIVLQGSKKIYLSVQSTKNKNDLVYQLESLSKLSSRENLPLLIARSLSGVKLEFELNPPVEMPRGKNKFYFRLATYGNAWEAVKETNNVAVYVESPPEDLIVDIMVLND